MPFDDNMSMAGNCMTIECAIRSDGSKPAEKALNKLRMRKKDRARFFAFEARFEHLTDTGHLPTNFLDGYSHGTITDICKFKCRDAYPYRIPCFKVGNSYILTHMFEKREGDSRQIKKRLRRLIKLGQSIWPDLKRTIDPKRK